MKVTPSTDYPIRPEDIDSRNYFLGTFGSFEAEETARCIVRFCQRSGDWGPFTISDLQRLVADRLHSAIRMIEGKNALGAEYVERDECEPKVYYVTDHFIDYCYAAFPAKRV